MPSPRLNNILKDWRLWPNICQSQPSHNELIPLNEGLTNENWLLKPDGSTNTYVIRCNAENQSSFYINRQHERSIHQSVSETGLCPAVIYENPEKQYWIRPYITGNTLASLESIDSFLQPCIKTLKSIHQLPIDNQWPTLKLSTRINLYWSQLSKKNPTNNHAFNQLNKIIEQNFDIHSKYRPALCHMDCNLHNWIANKDKVFLIDWEYAHLGKPAWDLAIFCNSAKLNLEQIKQVLNIYGAVTYEELLQASLEMQYLETLWYAIKLDQTYDELAIKLHALFNL